MTHAPITSGEFEHKNYTVLAIDGSFLSYTSPKRAKQLLDQGKVIIVEDYLIQMITEITPKVHLNEFWKAKYELIDRLVPEYNCCYVCGATDNFTKHHVIPRCYIRHFPNTIEMNLRLYFLCAILCTKCHESYEHRIENNASDFKNEIIKRYFPFSSLEYSRLRVLSGTAMSYFDLLQKGDIFRARKLKDKINTILDGDDFEELLRLSLTFHRRNSNFFKLIVENISDLNEFIELWKQHFIDSMNPQFLPKEFDIGWKDESA